MKNLATFFFLLFSSVLLTAQDVQFFQGSWEEANALAARENKLIMVDAYTDWCGPCKQMDKLMFHNNAEVADVINKNFIAYKIDCERDFGLVFSRKFKVMGYPSLLFFNSDGQLIDRKLGFDANQKGFLSSLQSVIDKNPADVYGYNARQLDMDWPEFYARSFRNANDSNWVSVKNPDVSGFLGTRSDLTDEISWAVMCRFPLDEKYTAYFKQNYELYEKLYKSEASNKMQNLLFQEVSKAAQAKDKAALEDIKTQMARYFPGDPDNMGFYMEQYYYSVTEDWPAYAGMLQAVIDSKSREVSIDEINSVAWNLYEKTDDRTVLKMALGWFRPYLDSMTDYYSMDTYAALLFKLDFYDDAEGWAIKAIEAGKADNMNVQETEQLLEKIRAVNR